MPARKTTTTTPVEGKKPRVQLTKVLGIDISQARCATHLKQSLGDADVEGQIRDLRAELKTTTDATKVDSLKVDIAELSKSCVRVSSAAPIATSAIWDSAVKELMRRGMDSATADNLKLVEVKHLHAGPIGELTHAPMYVNCDAWANYTPEHEDKLKKERTAANKLIKETRERNKKARDEAKAAGLEEDVKPVKVAKEPAAAADGTKTTFNTYVDNALATVKKDEAYANMRVSNRVREYLSDLITQGITHLAMLARIIVKHGSVRTMNTEHVQTIVHMLMANDGRSDEQIGEVMEFIAEKITIYDEHKASGSAARELALSAEDKDELARKGREADLNRKTKQAAQAKKRALEASQKAKTLLAETRALKPKVDADKKAVK